jgi:predicted dehydrogenase
LNRSWQDEGRKKKAVRLKAYITTLKNHTMKKNYNWGILGPGKIAHQVAAAIASTSNGRVYAVGSRDLLRAEAFAAQYGAGCFYGSYEALIADPEVDIVYIATPHHLHYEYTKKCLQAGKPVMCEKPATINLRQFEELMHLARERNVFYMDALWTRFLPSTLKVLEWISEGRIGEIKAVRADFGFRAAYDPAGRLFNPALGGGSILDIGIYPIFLSLLLLGYPNDIKVNAVMAGTGVDASCNLSFRYREGAIASLFSTFLAESDTSAEICGTGGRICMHRLWYRTTRLTLVNGDGETHFQQDHRLNGKEYEVEEVMRCLEAGLVQSPLLPLSFTADLMRLMDEVRKQAGVAYKEDL